MKKKPLNRRQGWRQQKIQSERLVRAEKINEKVSEAIATGELGSEQTGLVIAHFGKLIDVEAADGKLVQCHLRQNIDAIVTGDKVAFRESQDGTGVVTAMFPRISLLARQAGKRKKPMAANLTQALVVIAKTPLPTPIVLDRYLVALSILELQPTLVVNKSDLLHPDDPLFEWLKYYEKFGLDIVLASTKIENGLHTLETKLRDQTSILVGQSGVGKSSLIRTLCQNTSIRVGELSAHSQLGQHTTSTAKLYHLPNGGTIIDSPGIRDFGLWPLDFAHLAQGFVEFRPYLGKCRFKDCRHVNEPQCAIKEAVEAGQISEIRYNHYLSFLNETQFYAEY